MDWFVSLYAAQPFWLWLAVGVVLLGIEAAASTEWLLWPAVSAGLTALVSALAPQMGLPVEIGIFAALTVVSTVLSRRLIKRVNPKGQPDINDPDMLLPRQHARVGGPLGHGPSLVIGCGPDWPGQ